MFDLYLTLSIIGLFFSILFSSAEIALLSANPLQINVWYEQKKIRLLHWSEKILNNWKSYESKFLKILPREFGKIINRDNREEFILSE